MKTIKFLSHSLFVLFLSISISSCSGDDGSNGTDGVTGPAGADGNANVISSGWTAYDAANWSDSTVEYTIEYRNYPISESKITDDIVANGVVLVYTRFFEETYILPFTEKITSGGQQQILSFRIDTGMLTIKIRNVSGSGDPGSFSGDDTNTFNQYRYIIVPASNLAAKRSSQVDYKDYYAVCEYYGINPE